MVWTLVLGGHCSLVGSELSKNLASREKTIAIRAVMIESEFQGLFEKLIYEA